MKAGLVSSAAYEIQLTADCELPRFDTRGSWSFWGFFSEDRESDGRPGRACPTSKRDRKRCRGRR